MAVNLRVPARRMTWVAASGRVALPCRQSGSAHRAPLFRRTPDRTQADANDERMPRTSHYTTGRMVQPTGPGPTVAAVLAAIAVLVPAVVEAHGRIHARRTVPSIARRGGRGPAHVSRGQKHMKSRATIILLFLVGVVFFLYRHEGHRPVRQPVHRSGTASRCSPARSAACARNPHLVDAIIGLSIVYKALREHGTASRGFSAGSPTRAVAVLVFGLCHGFGLATKLQDFARCRGTGWSPTS